MSKPDGDLWRGLSEHARAELISRDYSSGGLAHQLSATGVDASKLVAARDSAKLRDAWIPGVEIFPRTIYPQRHRGSFGEFARRDEGLLAKIGLWPAQWAAARMFAQTAKGFHIHPPSIPADAQPSEWFRRLFIDEPENYSLRRYPEEQWDVMFFVQGVVEMILREAREGMPARTMRFIVDGDDHRSANNVAIVIPPGVAHALRVEGSEDLLMVYGTSTSFRPDFEGRIASDVETAQLPESWQRFLER
jgi:mannose-6-phosphate isomerase-like protein (cupin superfamily)